mmetsp:Transcript_36879/g.72513  ORF Transcript_36879/g.72513 Transcript_36879/m.72513 type:complete len:96 (-) Transcript_36879:22-309(-)
MRVHFFLCLFLSVSLYLTLDGENKSLPSRGNLFETLSGTDLTHNLLHIRATAGLKVDSGGRWRDKMAAHLKSVKEKEEPTDNEKPDVENNYFGGP